MKMSLMYSLSADQINNFREGCLFEERKSTVLSTDFSLDGKYYIAANRSDQILWYDCLRGSEKNLVNSHKYGVELVKYTHGKTAVLHTSKKVNYDLRLLDVEQQNYYKYYTGHTRKVTSLTTSADEDIFASGSQDGTVRIWDFREDKCVGKIGVNTDNPHVEFDPSGLFFLIGFDNETIYMYDMRSYKREKFFRKICLEKEGNLTAHSFKYSRDGTKLLVSTTGSKIMLFDPNNGIHLGNLRGFENSEKAPIEASFTPDSKHVISGSTDGNIHFWDTDDLLKVAKLPSKHRGPVRFVKFNPKHLMFASSCSFTSFWVCKPRSPKNTAVVNID